MLIGLGLLPTLFLKETLGTTEDKLEVKDTT